MNPLWTELAAKAGGHLDESRQTLLSRYLDLLLQANATMNLTRITDRAQAEVQHVGDALTLLPFLPPPHRVGDIGSGQKQGGFETRPYMPPNQSVEIHGSQRQGGFETRPYRLVDIGSGGGVPGVPLAIARPDMQVMLIESTKKKAAFLKETVAALELKNVIVSEWRAEEVGRSNHRESFDIAVIRAVATMVWLAEWSLPLVKKGGKVLAMKGPKAADELPEAKKAIKLLGGGEAIVHPVDLPGTQHRVIVEIRKLAKTDAKYPRPATQAKGKPLR